jgi:2-polyprenyl-3-methyl-5-hydroxy-6-metoxy-1,4-benzoquinol methylase
MREYTVGNLPIWLGTQPSPAFETAPFSFTISEHGLVRMANQDIVNRMVEAYSDDGYHFITSPPGASEWGNELARKSISGLLKTYGSIEGKHILEIGGGTLFSAETMINEYGAASVTLIDPAVKDTPTTDKITVKREYFNNNTQLDRDFDLIVSFNTLEHVPDPISFLQAISKRLTDNAKLYLKLPECGESLAMGDLGLCVHEHLSYFTPNSLDTCFAVAGLKRVDESNYKGALQVLAMKASVDTNAYCHESENLLEKFDKNHNLHLGRIEILIQKYNWKTIGFVGCSVGLSNVLNLLPLKNSVNIRLFDNDALKKGQFIPGITEAVDVPTQEALSKCDAIFITPVNFAQEIETKLRQDFTLTRQEIHPVFKTP